MLADNESAKKTSQVVSLFGAFRICTHKSSSKNDDEIDPMLHVLHVLLQDGVLLLKLDGLSKSERNESYKPLQTNYEGLQGSILKKNF